jgi:hypothetical protein
LNAVVGRGLSVDGNVVALPQRHFLEILGRTEGVKCSYLSYWLGKLLHSCSGSFNTEDNYTFSVGEEGILAESQSC